MVEKKLTALILRHTEHLILSWLTGKIIQWTLEALETHLGGSLKLCNLFSTIQPRTTETHWNKVLPSLLLVAEASSVNRI